jgi:molybdate transport system substrate-binding protein
VEINVFAAASMTESLNQIIEAYKTGSAQRHRHRHLRLLRHAGKADRAGRGVRPLHLRRAKADERPGRLSENRHEKNPNGEDYVLQGSRVDILENKVALVVPAGNPAKTSQSFEDLPRPPCKLKMPRPGQQRCARGQLLPADSHLSRPGRGRLEKAGKITYGSNVKEVTTQVRSGRGGLRHHLRHRRLLRTGRRQQDGSVATATNGSVRPGCSIPPRC